MCTWNKNKSLYLQIRVSIEAYFVAYFQNRAILTFRAVNPKSDHPVGIIGAKDIHRNFLLYRNEI